MSAGRAKAVAGFVVKKEYWEINAAHVRVKHREVVSRVYHSRDAAVTLRNLLYERNKDPDVFYYVHEKGKSDNVTLF